MSASLLGQPEVETRLPPALEAAGVRGALLLDVRPILERGGDPFRYIMKTLEGLEEDEALHLVVGFDPTPLHAVMRSLGRVALTEQLVDAFHVWYYRVPGQVTLPRGASERVPLAEPVHLDVRGLEPPGPLLAILERLADLGPGAQLLVHHHREPVLLYEKLEARGFAARTEQRGPADFVVHIAPAWAFEDESRS